MAPGVSELLTLSTYATGNSLADNISKGNAALMKMEEKGNIKTFDGGVTIRHALDYGTNSPQLATLQIIGPAFAPRSSS